MLADAGYDEVRVDALHEPARLGTDVADVLAYATNTTQVRELFAKVDDDLAGRIRATMAEMFAERERDGGIWVRAAAYLVTAVRPARRNRS